MKDIACIIKGVAAMMLLTLSLSCNRATEPDLEINLSITERYLPVSVEFNANDIDDEQKKQLVHLVNNEHIVNDVSEIPVDPLGLNDAFGEAFRAVNFANHTLLIKYMLHDWSIDTYYNRYYKNTRDNTYNWSINVGTASDLDVDSDNMRLTRFAILVNKLPADAEVHTWFGLSSLVWSPWK